MSREFFCRRRANRFAQLLDEANGGRRHHARSRVDDDLNELLAVARRVGEIQPAADVDPDFRTGLRAMLLATAERDGIGVTASPDPLGEENRGAASSGSPFGLRGTNGTGRPLRARGALLVGVAAGAIAVSGMSAASENAVPGDALYGMKRSTERAQLALASSDLSRGQLFLDFAHTRLAEAGAVRADSAGLARVLDDMDADTRQGVKLLTTAAVQRRDEAGLDAISTFLTRQLREVTPLLDGSRADRDRVLESIDLLDAIKRRADGLRAALRCGAAPSTRADALGPLAPSCATGKGLPGVQPSSSAPERRSGGRAPEESAPHSGRSGPSVPAATPPSTPGTDNGPKMTNPEDVEPEDMRPGR